MLMFEVGFVLTGGIPHGEDEEVTSLSRGQREKDGNLLALRSHCEQAGNVMLGNLSCASCDRSYGARELPGHPLLCNSLHQPPSP